MYYLCSTIINQLTTLKIILLCLRRNSTHRKRRQSTTGTLGAILRNTITLADAMITAAFVATLLRRIKQ